MRVLITGHNGYIGSVLAPMVRAAGHDVVGLDTFLFEGGTFGVHWDKIGRIPGFRGFVMSRSDGVWFAGIDERAHWMT